jgi:hypothetical protein
VRKQGRNLEKKKEIGETEGKKDLGERDNKPEDGHGRERTKTINKQSTLKNNFNTVKDDESQVISGGTHEKERTRQRKRGKEPIDSTI